MGISKELREALDHLEHAAMGYAQYPNMHTNRRLNEARESFLRQLQPPALIIGKHELEQVELYRLQMAGISTAAIGYWKEGEAIHPDYDTLALRDVAKLHVKYVEAVHSKDGAYEERNRVVALLCSLLPAVRCKTAIEGWSEDWHGCVYLTLPNGQQASWHYHDSQADLFAHVPEGQATWDGHTTPEKYQRIAACCNQPRGELSRADIIELARRFDVYIGSPEDRLIAYSRHLLSLPHAGAGVPQQVVDALIKERDGWQDEAKAQQRKAHLLQCDLDLRRAHQTNDAWYFQGDGEDHIESMGNHMVVVIHANDLRALIAPRSEGRPIAARFVSRLSYAGSWHDFSEATDAAWREDMKIAGGHIEYAYPSPQAQASQVPMTRKQTDAIWDQFQEAPQMEFRYLVTQALERGHGIGIPSSHKREAQRILATARSLGKTELSQSHICLMCKRSGLPPLEHGTLDDGVTPCPNGEKK